MVRGGGGRYVAATVALIEKQQIKVKNKDTQPKDNVESMDDSTLKCNSSTDSGKDDHSLITSTSSTSSNSNEDLDSICCKNDFQWVVKKENLEKNLERGRERKQPEVRMRKASASLDRKRVSRRERDYKCRSSSTKYHSPTRHHDCCHDYRPYCDYNGLNSQIHDFRIPYFYRAPPPPLPCEYPPYRYVSKPTNELQEQLRRFESDKESLSLQVAVLTDQVEAQAEKIADLERTISEQKRQINISGDLLQREMLTRSSLETQKLELLAVVSEMKRHESQIEKDNIELRDRLAEEKRKHKPPLAPRNHIYPTSSTPTNFSDPRMSPSPSPLSITHSSRKLDYTDSSTPQQKISGGQYRSLPRDQSESAALRRAVVFGRPTEHPRCSSVPNLADSETVVINQKDGEPYSKESSPSMQSGAPKGIRKIFGKMKRSNSGNLDDIPSDEPFTRGGVRSTAGPRLCGNSPVIKNDKPFGEWTSDEVVNWMKEMGVENISQDAKKWIQNGQTLLSATPQEIDKELNIKHSLLRKKLHLALEAERGVANGDAFLECAGRLEPGWVLRWLDDIGLPQYKANFMASRLDGRVLHRLTMDDLQSLHITLALHFASIRTGIQVLRKKKFDPHCLVRRSDPENETDDSVELWTNHRVMEWLRVVDLAEYAPNLRGSGVHGALMVHEDRFTDTLLASLLSIPSEKTLLRRHLSTHFKQLLGTENIQKKREAEATLGYIPLTVNLKIKLSKKSQFTLKRKKSKYDIEEGELVCPLNDSKGSQSTTGDSSPDLGKSPNHVGASPDKSSITSQISGGKKKNERISDV